MDKKYVLYWSSDKSFENGLEFSSGNYELGYPAVFKLKGEDKYLQTSRVKGITNEGSKLRIKTKNSEYVFLVI